MYDQQTQTNYFLQTILPRFFHGTKHTSSKEDFVDLDLIEELPRVPEIYLKHIENTSGIYEIRVQTGNDIFRIFCFFNKDKCIILGNGFQKKTEKTPMNQITLAQKKN